MAYVSQEKKKQLAPAIKAVLKKYGMKGSIAVRHNSSLVVNIKEGVLDLLGSAQRHNDDYALRRGQDAYQVGTYLQVNDSWCEEWAREVGDERIADFYGELIAAMKGSDWFCEDDIQSDYFFRAHYIDINVGKCNKPYAYTAWWDTSYVSA